METARNGSRSDSRWRRTAKPQMRITEKTKDTGLMRMAQRPWSSNSENVQLRRSNFSKNSASRSLADPFSLSIFSSTVLGLRSSMLCLEGAPSASAVACICKLAWGPFAFLRASMCSAGAKGSTVPSSSESSAAIAHLLLYACTAGWVWGGAVGDHGEPQRRGACTLCSRCTVHCVVCIVCAVCALCSLHCVVSARGAELTHCDNCVIPYTAAARRSRHHQKQHGTKAMHAEERTRLHQAVCSWQVGR